MNAAFSTSIAAWLFPSDDLFLALSTNVLIDVKIAEKELEKKLKELEVVQRKSFLERLLKQ